MDDYYPLGISCVHCGEELAARRVIDSSIQIKGLHKLDYLHAGSGLDYCTLVRPAEPYDGWKASAAYDAARATEREGVEECATRSTPATAPATRTTAIGTLLRRSK